MHEEQDDRILIISTHGKEKSPKKRTHQYKEQTC